MNPASWRALILYSLPLVTYLQVTAGRQLIMGNMMNSDNEWINWSEVNSIDGIYWVVHNDSSSSDGVVLLNTSMSWPSSASGSGVIDPQYTLLSPMYIIVTNNCNSSISYTRRVDVIVEVMVRSNNENISVANLSGTVGERKTQSITLNQSAMQLIFRVMSNLNDELLSIDDINFSDCFDSISPTSTIPMMMESSLLQTSTDIVASSDSLTVSRMSSTSSSHFSLPASSSMMITSVTPSVLVSVTEEISMFMSATISTSDTMPTPTIMMSSPINTVDIVSDTLSVIQSVSSSSLIDVSTASTESSVFVIMTESPSLSVSISTTSIMPSSFNESESDNETFFSTNVIIGIAGGGALLIIVCVLVTCCCLCYRVRINRRNQHRYFINNNTGHKGHSSVYAQERYRNKSRSVESVSGPYQYELPFVHIETAPEAYTHSINGDDDTIDSESEDIRYDLKGTPTSSHRGSLSATEQPTKMTSFYPQKEELHWSDYDGDSNQDETNSDIVYSNRKLVDEMCGAELPPILSLGDYEDDENVIIVNPYNPTFYSESNPIDESPRRHTTTKSNINLEALTTLEPSGEYTPKQSVPNYRRKQMPRSSAVGKNNKALRKTKSEINLEDATKIGGASRYPKHPHKSRIDLKEATKLGHSRSDGYQYRRPHHSSTPRILNNTSSRLERLTSLNTT